HRRSIPAIAHELNGCELQIVPTEFAGHQSFAAAHDRIPTPPAPRPRHRSAAALRAIAGASNRAFAWLVSVHKATTFAGCGSTVGSGTFMSRRHDGQPGSNSPTRSPSWSS